MSGTATRTTPPDTWAGRLPTFGETLARLRQQRGLSQSRLGVEAEIDHSYVSKLESHQRNPSRDAVCALAEALTLTPGERDLLLITAGYLPSPRGVAMLADALRPGPRRPTAQRNRPATGEVDRAAQER